jgi:hypothetical protein
MCRMTRNQPGRTSAWPEPGQALLRLAMIAAISSASPAAGYLTGKILEVDGGLDRPSLDLGLRDL